MPSEWTIDTLREHFDEIMRERDRAVVKLADEVTARFGATNQWRETLMDIQSRNVSRATFDTALESLRREIDQSGKEITSITSDLRALRDTTADFKISTDQRFHQVNEFRAAMADQQKTYLPKQTWDTGHEFLRQQVEGARIGLTELEGKVQVWQAEIRESVSSLRSRMVGAVAAVSTVMAVVVALVALLKLNV